MTNADIIRNMTDEELAEHMSPLCPPKYDVKKCRESRGMGESYCRECRTKWLQSEPDDEDMEFLGKI